MNDRELGERRRVRYRITNERGLRAADDPRMRRECLAGTSAGLPAYTDPDATSRNSSRLQQPRERESPHETLGPQYAVACGSIQRARQSLRRELLGSSPRDEGGGRHCGFDKASDGTTPHQHLRDEEGKLCFRQLAPFRSAHRPSGAQQPPDSRHEVFTTRPAIRRDRIARARPAVLSRRSGSVRASHPESAREQKHRVRRP